jgi:Fe-S-cluster containining protein
VGCLRCGNCCTRFGVCITPFDILRLEQGGKLAASFVSLVEDRQEREREEPGILIDGSYWLLALARDKKEVCCFHGREGCAVYESRPMLCRSYPFVLRKGKLVQLKSRACAKCWRLGAKEKEEYLRDAKQYAAEVAEYRKIAAEWNRKGGGSLREFLKFALGKII